MHAAVRSLKFHTLVNDEILKIESDYIALRPPGWVGGAVPRDKFLEAFFEPGPRVVAE
jgi:hypothetical protein